jgi:hypothetical protein
MFDHFSLHTQISDKPKCLRTRSPTYALIALPCDTVIGLLCRHDTWDAATLAGAGVTLAGAGVALAGAGFFFCDYT